MACQKNSHNNFTLSPAAAALAKDSHSVYNDSFSHISSGQGEIPDRRYSPRTLRRRSHVLMIWCDSKTDSIVWMEEDTMELPPRSLCCVDQKALTLLDRPSGLYHIQEVLLWQRKIENSIL